MSEICSIFETFVQDPLLLKKTATFAGPTSLFLFENICILPKFPLVTLIEVQLQGILVKGDVKSLVIGEQSIPK